MKLALIVQRYGKEVIGGAELLARELAERLAEHSDVEVLTTCARDHSTWANHYPAGVTIEKGVKIRRFRVRRCRDWESFGRWSQLLFLVDRRIRLPAWVGRRWVIYQGPFAPQLTDHLQACADRFDVLLFFTYLYYPTVFGLRSAPDKSVLIPTAHNEPAIRLKVFEDVFKTPRYLVFLSDEEKKLVCSLFGERDFSYQTIGMGIALRRPSRRDQGYLLYIGRVEPGKNCEMMFDYCRRARITLKVAGPTRMQVPDHVEYLGPVSEETKVELLRNCRAVIVPSALESLSIAALEAWANGKPVLAWEKSPVLRGQIARSGGGCCFGDFEDFLRITRTVNPQIGLRGWDFVKKNYAWESVLPKYEKVLEMAAGQTSNLE